MIVGNMMLPICKDFLKPEYLKYIGMFTVNSFTF